MNDKVQNDRHNTQPETLQDLQESLYDWQKYNFGDQGNEMALVGICEEAGELCHAQLKLEQGIRGSSEAHNASMRDAIGDLMIYSINYMSGLGESIQTFAPRNDIEVTVDSSITRAAVLTVFRMAGNVAGDPCNISRILRLTSSLIYLSALKGWNLETIIRDTWIHISPRDWKNYPVTGYPAPEVSHSHQAQQPSTLLEEASPGTQQQP